MKKNTRWLVVTVGGMLMLILNPNVAHSGAALGLEKCIKSVIPVLFPFFFLNAQLCSNLSGASFPILSKLCRLLGIPRGQEHLLISGYLGGYPIGAQSVAAVWKLGDISRANAERLLGFCNNAGPSFIFGVIAQNFTSITVVWTIWCIHILSSILVGIILPKKQAVSTSERRTTQVSKATIQQNLSSALKATAMVCGWVVLFSTVISFLSAYTQITHMPILNTVVSGILELTNGCLLLQQIQSYEARFVLANVLLAFGGICVLLQTKGVVNGLSIRTYILGKFLQTLFAIYFSLVFGVFIFPNTFKPFSALLLMVTIFPFIGYRFFKQKREKGWKL